MSRGSDKERERERKEGLGWGGCGRDGVKGRIKGKGGMETSKESQTWKMPASAHFIPLFPKARAKSLMQVYS